MWRKLSRDDQDMVKKFNGRLHRKRERDNSSNRYEDSKNLSITQRRNPIGEPETKRIMSEFDRDAQRHVENPINENHGENPEEEEKKPLTMRRDLIRFRLNK